MPRAADIAAALGKKKLRIRTAEDLGLADYVTHSRPLSYYARQERKAELRSEQFKYLVRLYHETGNKNIGYLVSQRRQQRKRNYYWRRRGYPNLVAAWAARRKNAALRREQKVLDAERDRLTRLMEAYSQEHSDGR